MNKKLLISYGLIVAMTLLAAVLMIGCGTEINLPEGTTGSLNASSTQTIGSSDHSENSNTEDTFDTPDTDEISGSFNPTGNVTDSTKPVEPTIFVGVVDGAGSRDPDEDDSVVPNNPTSSSVPKNPSTPTNANAPTSPSEPVDATESTESEETTKPVTTPAATPQKDNPLGEGFDIDQLTFEEYEWGMTAEQQKAVIDLFSTPNDFVKWYNAMAAQYKAEHPEIEIGQGGNVDLTSP